MRSFGQDLEQVGAYSTERFIGIRAGNEYNEFLGAAKLEEQNLTNYIQANPYATEQQLKQAKSKMLTNIKTASGKLTTRQAKDWANRSYLSQMDVIEAHVDGVIEGQIREIEMSKFKMNADAAVAAGDYEGLVTTYETAVKAGLLPAGKIAQPTKPFSENEFRTDYTEWAKKNNIDTNPDDPEHKYDYRGYYKKHGGFPSEAGQHLTGEFKAEDHPTRRVRGLDTAVEHSDEEILNVYKGDRKKAEAEGWTLGGNEAEKGITQIMFERDAALIHAANGKALLEMAVVEWSMEPDKNGNPKGHAHATKKLAEPETLAMLNEMGIPLEDAKAMLDDAKAFAAAQEAAGEHRQEEATEERRGTVAGTLDLPPDAFLDAWPDQRTLIQNDPDMKQDEKDKLKAKGDARVKALASGEYDPLDNHDNSEFRRINDMISTDPTSVNENADIRNNIKLSPPLKDALVKKLKENTTTTSGAYYGKFSTALSSLEGARSFSDNKTKNATISDKLRYDYIMWSLQEGLTKQDHIDYFEDNILAKVGQDTNWAKRAFGYWKNNLNAFPTALGYYELWQDILGVDQDDEAAAGPKELDKATARRLMIQADGDKDKARELAKERGYTF
jgi:hypothetical protein